MINFFRRIRQRLLTEHKISKYLLYAVGEIALVMVGILLALQVNNWNENRKNQNEQFFILDKLQDDINSDINTISLRRKSIENDIKGYITCLEVLGRKRDLSESEFRKNFSSILGITFFDQNATTFNNLVSSGKLELITNKALSNTIVKYYTEDYKAWETALRDYTRNVIGPYLFQFDHIPQLSDSDSEYQSEYTDSVTFYRADISSFGIKPKTLEDYRKDLFIINALKQKLYTFQGQLGAYKYLSGQMKQLERQIEQEKDKLKKYKNQLE